MKWLLDGATGTAMIAAGAPADGCMEEWILSHPDTLVEVQKRYIAAGCEVLTAPTFGANRARLAQYGWGDRTTEWNRRLVELTRQAIAQSARHRGRGAKGPTVQIAGNLSPTGLAVEPFGEASVAAVRDIYREQAAVLRDAGVDLLIIETMTSLNEARAAMLAARDVRLPALVTMSPDKRGRTLCGEEDLLACLMTLQAMGVAGFGVNCTAAGDMVVWLEQLWPYARIPLVAQPWGAEPDGENGWKELAPLAFAQKAERLLQAGAGILGGCCGSVPEHLAVLRGLMDRAADPGLSSLESEAVAGPQGTLFLSEDLEPSPALPCNSHLEDALIEAEETCNAARVLLEEPEDVAVFLEAAQVCALPLVIHTEYLQLLEEALLRYPGRLLVDTVCEIDEEELSRLSKRYGAVLF